MPRRVMVGSRKAVELVFWGQMVTLAALLVGSFFFAMAETAMVRADRMRVKGLVEEGNARAVQLENLLANPEKTLTTIIVGNNIVNIVAASLATVVALQMSPARGAVLAPIVITAVVLIFGEIAPKTLAVRKADAIALRVARSIRICQMILGPISNLLSAVAFTLLRMFGVKADPNAPFVTQEQIQLMVREGVREGEVEHFERRVIDEVFEFTETNLEEVMTPRGQVNRLEKTDTLRMALDLARQTGHSRLPVIDGDFDHVLGFVHAKDLLRFTDEELETEPVTDVLRAVLFVRSEARADHVLARMQKERKLMSIVQDEHGRNLGIATVEDLLEELVGEIHDEFDRHMPKTVKEKAKAKVEAAAADDLQSQPQA